MQRSFEQSEEIEMWQHGVNIVGHPNNTFAIVAFDSQIQDRC